MMITPRRFAPSFMAVVVTALFGFALAVAVGCSAVLDIRCHTSEQCLDGQVCRAGACTHASLDSERAGDADASDASDARATSDTLDGGAVDGDVPEDCPSSGCAAASYCDAVTRTCRPCASDDRCGPSCTSCAGTPTPRCADGVCVQCVVSSDCPSLTPCCVANICQIAGC
jgi:hypothetical protein